MTSIVVTVVLTVLAMAWVSRMNRRPYSAKATYYGPGYGVLVRQSWFSRWAHFHDGDGGLLKWCSEAEAQWLAIQLSTLSLFNQWQSDQERRASRRAFRLGRERIERRQADSMFEETGQL